MKRTNIENSSGWALLAWMFVLTLAVAPAIGCSGAGDSGADGAEMADAAGHDDAGEEHVAAEGGEEHAEAEGGAEHVHPAGDDVPSRADEVDRDEYSKPMEVYAFLGIDEGATVIDVGAGSGYNTYLLSGVVGSSGRVIAERGNEGLQARIDIGDLHEAGPVEIVGSIAEIPDSSADFIILVREYHLVEDWQGLVADMRRVLRPGGVAGIVEVRNNRETGHDWEIHRVGEGLVTEQLGTAGFELVDSSDILRRDDDDYTVYAAYGPRYISDRMLLKFRRPE